MKKLNFSAHRERDSREKQFTVMGEMSRVKHFRIFFFLFVSTRKNLRHILHDSNNNNNKNNGNVKSEK